MTTQTVNEAMRLFTRLLTLTAIGIMWSSVPPIHTTWTVQAQSQPAQSQTTQTDFDCTTVSQIPQMECEALVAIYNGTGGPDWSVNTNWLQTTTPCSWYGVMCSDGHVTELDLDNDGSGNNLIGALPGFIGDLSSLTLIDLAPNELSSIPPELGNLSKLTWLTLSSNELSSIPPELGNLSNLITLHLHSNRLSSIPSEFGNLFNLKTLYLDRNELSSIPPELSNLSNLTDLDISYNQLSDLPAQFIRLTNLNALDVDNNHLINVSTEMTAFLDEKNAGWANSQTELLTPIATPTNTPTGIPTNTPTRVPTNTPTNSPTFTSSPTSTFTPSPTLTFTPSPTLTFTPSPTPTFTPLPTAAATHTPTLIPTSTLTPTHTPTNTPSPTSTSTPSSTPTLTPTPSTDPYENDNNCNFARPVTIDNEPQLRNFHTSADIDWATFTVSHAGIYRIEVTVPGDSRADIDLYYYNDCDSLEPNDQFVETFAPGASIDVHAEHAGEQYYIELYNNNSEYVGADAQYRLSVRLMVDTSIAAGQSDEEDEEDTGGVIVAPGPAIVVAGFYRNNDPVQDNIDQTAQRAYNLFKSKGRTDSEIYFLSANSEVDHFDGPATLRRLEYAITDWAKQQLVREDVITHQVLTLYLIDHGGPDEFYLNKINQEILTPNDLHEWLETLEKDFPDLRVNVIIEACKSGTFIEQRNGSISKPNRVIITSSNAGRDAFVSYYGAAFSDNFLTFLNQEYSLGYSFQEASNIVDKQHRSQNPWIDANGNGIHNEPDDIAQASLRGFHEDGTFGGDWPPYIADVTYETSEAARTSSVRTTGSANMAVMFRAEVRHQYDNDAIHPFDDANSADNDDAGVWAVVYPPDYAPPSDDDAIEGDEQLNDAGLTVIDFAPENTAKKALFVGAYDGFTQPGIYRVIIHARDIYGLQAQPVTIEVMVEGVADYQIFLPAVSR